MAGDELLNRKQAAAYLRAKGCATGETTLARLAMHNNEGGGPSYIVYRRKKKNHIRYPIKDLDAWAAKQIRRVE